jgi:hypothetical protein
MIFRVKERRKEFVHMPVRWDDRDASDESTKELDETLLEGTVGAILQTEHLRPKGQSQRRRRRDWRH